MSGRLDARALSIAVLLTVIWGGSYTMVKLGFRDLPVLGAVLLRLVCATVVLAAWSWATGAPVWYRGRAAWLLLAGAVAFVWSQVFLYLGISLTTAGRSSILFNTQPFFTLLLMPMVARTERLTARRVAGTVLAFAGVVLVFADRLGGGVSVLGDVFVLLGALGWSANTVLTKLMPRHVHPASIVLWGTAAGIPVMGVLVLALEPGARWRLTPLAVASVLYLGAVAAGFSFVAFSWLIRHYSAIRVNAFVFLAPVFGVLVGSIVLGDPLSLGQALGALGVAGGIWVVNTGA